MDLSSIGAKTDVKCTPNKLPFGYDGTMPKPLVTDELWALVEPLLSEEPPKPKGGRPRVDDRAALTGILFVLETGIPWEMLSR